MIEKNKKPPEKKVRSVDSFLVPFHATQLFLNSTSLLPSIDSQKTIKIHQPFCVNGHNSPRALQTRSCASIPYCIAHNRMTSGLRVPTRSADYFQHNVCLKRGFRRTIEKMEAPDKPGLKGTTLGRGKGRTNAKQWGAILILTTRKKLG